MIFARANLDPATPSPDAEILRALRNYGADLLLPRTVKLLAGAKEREVRDTLLELVAEELSEWNGEIPAENQRRGEHDAHQVQGGIRLCIRLDRPAARVTATLRCTLNRREFPEGGLVLSRGSDQAMCYEEIPGWSTSLVNAASGRPLDLALLDWGSGYQLAEQGFGWKFVWVARRVRVLVTGTAVGLPGLFEVNLLPRGRDFYLVFPDEEWRYLEHWALTCCEDFRFVSIDEGLRSGWRMASASRVISVSPEVASRYPTLSLPDRASIRLVGGIRSGPGASFFAFAAPSVVVERGTDDLRLLCNGQRLHASSDGVTYSLPKNLPVETRILLEIVADNDTVRRQSLYLTGDFSWNQTKPQEYFDEWGNPLSALGQRGLVAGALVDDEGDASFERPVHLVPGLSGHAGRRIFFIGRVPGQIVTWPSEPLPKGWQPVWGVVMARRGSAVFCGPGISDCVPLAPCRLDLRQVNRWKEVLWTHRKRIVPPAQPALARLWRLYLKAAGDV